MDTTRAIQVAVARADLIMCTIWQNIPKMLIALAVGFIAGKVVLICHGR